MPMYLTRFNYTPAAWAKLIENPVDRTKAVSAGIKSAGSKLHGLWYAFGEQDGFVLSEAPDNVSVAAALAAFGADRCGQFDQYHRANQHEGNGGGPREGEVSKIQPARCVTCMSRSRQAPAPSRGFSTHWRLRRT